MAEYSIAELAKLADVTPRTIRYYIEQGLIAPPELEGPKTRYSQEHLERLRAIKKLQATHIPLAEIRRLLLDLSPEQVAQVGEEPTPQPGAAIDYIRSVLGDKTEGLLSTPPAPGPWMLNQAFQWPWRGTNKGYWTFQVNRAEVEAPPAPSGPEPEPQTTRSQWERVSLDPDVELHIRRPLTRANNKRVERLISIARQLFEED